MANKSNVQGPTSEVPTLNVEPGTLNILFEPKPDAPRPVRVSHGEYAREFEGKWPQQATREEWEKFLQPTGFFKEVQGSKSKVQS